MKSVWSGKIHWHLDLVEAAFCNLFEDGVVLLLDDFVDLVLQSRTVEERGVVGSP